MRRMGAHKKLGRYGDRTADPKWPERYPTEYDIMLNINGGSWLCGAAYALGLTRRWLASVAQLCCTSLVLLIIFVVVVLEPISSCTFQFSPPFH